jgi:glycosyltransferase involved in cell wall biosynthesis
VCIPGRLDRVKGADLLPPIMRAVWRERPETRFVSIGQDTARVGKDTWAGWLLGQLPPAQRSRVSLRGGMPPARMAAEIAHHRIALIASVFETFPYTLMESMALGLSCVVACAGGAREMGEHGRHLMLAPRTPDAIAAVLVQLLSQPGTSRAIGAAAEAHVQRVLASATVTERVIAAYADVAAGHARRSAA